MLRPLLTLSLISPALAERVIEVQRQELRIDRQTPSAEGLRLEGQVRDRCRLYLQNPYWEEGHTEEEPERRLVVEPVELLLKQRGPRVSGEQHKLVAQVRSPTSLQGSDIELVHQDGSFLLPAHELGTVLILADFRSVGLPHLTLALDGQLLAQGLEPVELSWTASGRAVTIDTGELRIEGEVLEVLGQGWRCEALQKAAPADYAQLGEVQALAGYAAKTCPEAALVQGPPLCERAAGELQDLDSAVRLQAELAPVAEHCGSAWSKPAAAWAEEQLSLHVSRGDLDLALRVVEAFTEELGAERVETLDAELRTRAQAEIPSRFEWALDNGADEQARQLLDRYGPLLGPAWTEEAQARLR
jgi:hypothetical protein